MEEASKYNLIREGFKNGEIFHQVEKVEKLKMIHMLWNEFCLIWVIWQGSHPSDHNPGWEGSTPTQDLKKQVHPKVIFSFLVEN